MSEYSRYLKKVIDSVVRSGWYFEGFEAITEEELSSNPKLLVDVQSKLSSILEYNALLAKAGEGTPIGGILEDDSFKSYWNSQLYFEYLKQNEVESRIPLFDSLDIQEEEEEDTQVLEDSEFTSNEEELPDEVQEEFLQPNRAILEGFLGGGTSKEEIQGTHESREAKFKLLSGIDGLETLYILKNVGYKLLGGISSLEGTGNNTVKVFESPLDFVEIISKSSKTLGYKLLGGVEFLEGYGENESPKVEVSVPDVEVEFKCLGGISSLESLGSNTIVAKKVKLLAEYKLLGGISTLEGFGENTNSVKSVTVKRARWAEFKLLGGISGLEGIVSNTENSSPTNDVKEPSKPTSSGGFNDIFEVPSKPSNSYDDVFTPKEEKPKVTKKPQKFDTERQVDNILKGLGSFENKVVKGLRNGSLFRRNRKGS